MKPRFITWHKWRLEIAAKKLAVKNRECEMLDELWKTSRHAYYADRLIVAELQRVRLKQRVDHHAAKLTTE